MKLIKDNTGMYKYVSEDRIARVSHAYLGIENTKYWILERSGEKRKIFKTLKELKEYAKQL